jgi:hypothetical protein
MFSSAPRQFLVCIGLGLFRDGSAQVPRSVALKLMWQSRPENK